MKVRVTVRERAPTEGVDPQMTWIQGKSALDQIRDSAGFDRPESIAKEREESRSAAKAPRRKDAKTQR
jgi:hypothetical protein